MKVQVEQLDCTGSGQCELMLPEVFVVRDDGLATTCTPDGRQQDAGEPVEVPEPLHQRVRDVADICPGACILITDE